MAMVAKLPLPLIDCRHAAAQPPPSPSSRQILRHDFGLWHRLGRGRIFVQPCRSFRSEEESGVGEKVKDSVENFGEIEESNVVEAERCVNKFVVSVRNAVWRVSKPCLRSQGEFREALEKLEEKLFSLSIHVGRYIVTMLSTGVILLTGFQLSGTLNLEMDNIKQMISEMKSAAAYAKEEADDIKIGMETLAELLSHNIKLLLEISESHAKVTNEMKDKIDALKVQLMSTDTNNRRIDVLAQSYDTKQEYQQVPRSDPQCESSSGPSTIKRDTQSPRKLTIKSNDEHTRVIRIRTDEDDDTPLSAKEEEYRSFAKIIYELQENDSYFISSGDHVYPRLLITNDADSVMVKMAADYGFLDLIYPGKDLKEIERFDEIFKSEVSKFAKGRSIYIKSYSISPEIDGMIFYPAEHIITIGYVSREFQIDVGHNKKLLPKITRSWIKSRRVLGMKVLYKMAKSLYDKKFKCLCQYEGWTLLTNNGGEKSTILKEYIEKFDTHRINGPITTIQEACRIRECPTCRQNQR